MIPDSTAFKSQTSGQMPGSAGSGGAMGMRLSLLSSGAADLVRSRVADGPLNVSRAALWASSRPTLSHRSARGGWVSEPGGIEQRSAGTDALRVGGYRAAHG